ncbi:hypothetical protein DY000_02013379 [Brassica cretica]|uniref:Uncharacterized protein n=1 Tax=Brassica cretica TaxID=69181 RepID=A0ABQ7CUN7_BRACR|nr:hypothetical protein DY000_02013379 [Brassica cretica]
MLLLRSPPLTIPFRYPSFSLRATRVCGASGALTRSSSVGESKEPSTAALLVNRSRSGSDLTSPRRFCRASLPPFGVMAVFRLTDSENLFISFKLRQPGVSQEILDLLMYFILDFLAPAKPSVYT